VSARFAIAQQSADEILGSGDDCAALWRTTPTWFAIIAAGLDDRQAGLTWLERALERHDVWLVWLKHDPRLDPFRADARFGHVIDQVGLGQTTSLGRTLPSELLLSAINPATDAGGA
jgi:hypothetical protein